MIARIGAVLGFAAGLLASAGAFAQTVTAGAPVGGSSSRGGVNQQLVRLLQDEYEVKAAFAEAGVPYVILQKKTSAYLCRGAGAATCEKLN